MITVKHDHKLQFPTITVPKYSEDADDGVSNIKQTDIEGVIAPLLRFNNITITFEMVNYMKLTNEVTPQIEIGISDYIGLIKVLDTPGIDNILYLQILPPFDNAYKKIQLAFYIYNTSIDGNMVTLYGTYYVPGLFDSKMKAYGLLSSYELFDAVSNEYSLGFCSNVEDSSDDRYIYNSNRPMADFLNSEINFSGQKEHVYTWWIDFWNNINFIDLYDEYNRIYSDEEMQVWIFNNFKSTDNEVNEPFQQIAAFSNHPAFVSSPFYISDYTPISSSSMITDCNFEIYSMDDLDASSTVIQDGDVHNDIFMKYKYGGEVFGDFDYLSQRACRGMFINKINSQFIEIESGLPILGLMKGDHVNLWWYDINNIMANGAMGSDIETNAAVPDADYDDGDNKLIINKTISGQYYIMGIEYVYSGTLEWNVKYKLSRSAAGIEKLNPPSNETFMK